MSSNSLKATASIALTFSASSIYLPVWLYINDDAMVNMPMIVGFHSLSVADIAPWYCPIGFKSWKRASAFSVLGPSHHSRHAYINIFISIDFSEHFGRLAII